MKNFRLCLQVVMLLFVAGNYPVSAGEAKRPADIKSITAKELRAVVESSKAKVVVVNMWATFCPPCRDEMPELLQIFKDNKAKGMDLVLVSCDDEEDMAAAKKFLSEVGVGFLTYYKAENSETFVNGVSKDNWSGALPATFLYDKNKKERFVIIDRFDPKDLKAKLKTLLEE